MDSGSTTTRTVRKHETFPIPAVQSPALAREQPPARWDWEQLYKSAGRFSWTRYLAALRRYKFLLALVIAAAVAIGVAVARFVKPVYVVHSTIWIAPGANHDDRTGPMRGDDVMHTAAWPELLTSFAILEKVARRLTLYVTPAEARDSTLFRSFQTSEQFDPGQYELSTDHSGRRYVLSRVKGPRIENGVVGDSIGRTVGLRWAPPATVLGRDRKSRFVLVTPRTAALALRSSLTATLPHDSNLLSVTLTGTDPGRLAAIMKAVVEEFVATAADLKKRNLVEVALTLQKQLTVAAKDLDEAERALESFRVRTITLPSETRAMAADPAARAEGAASAGDDRARDPVSQSFFTEQISYDAARRDRLTLERTMAAVRDGSLEIGALSSVPAVRTEAPELQAALRELSDKQAKLGVAREQFTDAHPVVRELVQQVAELRDRTIPRAVAGLVTQLRMRESDLQEHVQRTARELRDVPVRTLDEARLRRNVATREHLYGTLKSRSEEASLAEASAVPDVSILDAPVAPESPANDRAPFVIVLATVIGIAIAAVLAFVLDRYDPRFRYPEQATEDLGLDIIGAVPAINPDHLRDQSETEQMMEAFRSIRLSVSQAADPSGRILVTISSPNAGDGKSLVSANLAQSFAEAGYRTLLIDGDIRRGELDKRFEVERSPGLLDYLTGAATLEQVLRTTSNDKLWIVTRGTHQQRAPELLMSPVVPGLMAELQRRFEAVVLDSSPLGAGIDPFILGAATGNMLLVLRAGESNRKLAQAKLKLLTKLPIRVLGVVLNDVRLAGDFQYYAYSYTDEKEETKLPALESQIDEFARRSGLLSLSR